MRDAQVRFDDRLVSRVRTVEALQLALLFLSNLPAVAVVVELKAEPRLAFKLGGTPFDDRAKAMPFAQRRNGAPTLMMIDLDLDLDLLTCLTCLTSCPA